MQINKTLKTSMFLIILILNLAVAYGIEYNNEETKTTLNDFSWCFDNPFGTDYNLMKENFIVYQDNFGTDLTDAKLYVRAEAKQSIEVCKNKDVCQDVEYTRINNITLKSEKYKISECEPISKCKYEDVNVVDWFDVEETNILMKTADRFCYIGKRNSKTGSQKIDMNFIYEDENIKVDVVKDNKMWWNESYGSKINLDCSNMPYGTPIAINGSNGFMINGEKQIVWSYCAGNETAIYYNDETDYVIANETDSLPFEVEFGNGTSYEPMSVWSNYYAHVYHSGTDIMIDSLNSVNLTEVGTITQSDGVFGLANDYTHANSNQGLTTGLDDVWCRQHTARVHTNTGHVETTIGMGGRTHVIRFFQSGQIGIGYVAPSWAFLLSGVVPNLNQWYDITHCYEKATKLEIYVDGVSKNSVEGKTIITSTTDIFSIGSDNVNGFDGDIDEVRESLGILSSDFIEDQYYNTQGITGYATLGETLQNEIKTNISVMAYTDTTKSVVLEGEDWRTWVNFSYELNGSSLGNNGFCNATINNAIKENYIKDIGTNLTITNTPLVTEITGLPQEGYIQDYLVVDACKDTTNNIKQMTISTNYSSSYDISYSNIPNCDTGYQRFAIHDSNSSGATSIQLTISTNGGTPKPIKIINSRRGIDREHNHLETIFFNETLNAYIGEELEFYEHGDKNISVNCYANISGVQNLTTVYTLVVENTPPEIFFDLLSDYYTGDQIIMSSTLTARYPLISTLNISGGCSDDDLFNAGYSLYYTINSSLIASGTFLANGLTLLPAKVEMPSSLFSTSNLFLDGDLSYTITGYCNDTQNNITYDTTIFKVVNDRPIISFDDVSPLNIYDPATIGWSCSDTEEETLTNRLFIDGLSVYSGVSENYLFSPTNYSSYAFNVSCEDSLRSTTNDTLTVIYSVGTSGNMSCVYDETPYIKEGFGDLTERNKIQWICSFPNKTIEYDCFTYVTFEGSLIQANPPEHYLESEKIDSFSSHNGIVKVWFLETDLRDGKSLDFRAECSGNDSSSEFFQARITPQYKDPYEMADRMIDAKNNKSYWIMGFILFILLFMFIGLLIKKAKGN